jgi:uncharacterized protein YqcC (DUF446 family)
MSDRYERARWILGNIVETMKDLELWEVEEPEPSAFDSRVAFYGDTMSFAQWLRFVLVPRLEGIIAERGTFPGSSMLGLKVLREYVHFGSLEGADYIIDALQRLDTFVELLGTKTTSLRFFEGPLELPPAESWQHGEQFPVATTRFIFWHALLSHSAPSVRFELELEARWTGPSGAEVFRQLQSHTVEPGWTSSYCCASYGASEPGHLPAGVYRVELLLWDAPLVGGGFTLS